MGQIGEITSVANKQVKYLKNLQIKSSARKKEGVFVTEGVKIFIDIPEKQIKSVYVADSLFEEMKNNNGFDAEIYSILQEKLKKIDYIRISNEVAASITDTVTPQGIFAVVEMMNYSLESIVKEAKHHTYLVLDEIKDPGNMGTLIRTARGAGITAIIMNNICVDIYNPKVVRSTMGSIFAVPIIIEETLADSVEYLKKNGVVTYGAHLNGTDYFAEDNLSGDVAIFIGNEAKGLSEEVSKMCDRLIKIPMDGGLESLNASVAGGILMYEAMRKRLQK